MRRRRIIPFTLTLGLFVGLLALLTLNQAGQARAGQSAPLAVQPGAVGAQGVLTATRPISRPQLTPVEAQPTISVPVTATDTLTVTALPTVAATPAPAAVQLPVVELLPDEVLTGTIVLNRTAKALFFFLDDDLYELPANRATGLLLARPLAGLTLFTCAADVTDDAACQWVSYPKVSADATATGAANLRLAVAVAPPLDTAWIQNRTGADAELLWGAQTLTITNTGLALLNTTGAAPATLYLPRCLQSSSQRICEWLPTAYSGGVYYALRQNQKAAGINGVTLARSELEPLLIQEALLTPTPTPEPEPVGLLCQTQIPSLNVRSGPGTDYQIIGKLRTSAENGGRVLAIGRTASGDWLAVDPRFVAGGWVANAIQWLVCDGDFNLLPVVEVAGEQPARPLPPAAPAASRDVGAPNPTPQAEQLPTPTPESGSPTSPGPKQALLIATNSFYHPIRFTLDPASHGLPEGTPSEYDLQPGESMRFVIRAGRVQFSASSAWRNNAGNAEFELAEGAAVELFIRFEPLEKDPNQWVMRFE
ncbi:MAG: SH3 domain-containing protein [Chloroflexi bacterium]|nr:MAG: SH3 domain-containing protein [Chloroflexota bacterium]